MNKKLKRSSLLAPLLILSMITPSQSVYAATSSLDRIDIEVTVNEDGTAHFKEIWNATVQNGTEASKQLIQLNGSEISNFKVTNELGKEYINVGTWDSSKSRIDKYTSCGTTTKLNGDTTLYWGLGDYGTRAYILEYDVSNFVENCEEGQFSYFTYIPPTQAPFPEDISIRIELPEGIGADTENCYSYGFSSSAKFTSTQFEEEQALKKQLGENEDVLVNTIDISAIVGNTITQPTQTEANQTTETNQPTQTQNQEPNTENQEQTTTIENNITEDGFITDTTTADKEQTNQTQQIKITEITENKEKPHIIVYEPQEYTFKQGNYVVLLTKYDTSDNQFTTTFSSNKSFINVLTDANEGMGLGVVTQPKTVKEIGVLAGIVTLPILAILFIRELWKRHKRIENKTGMPIKINFAPSNIVVNKLENVQPKEIDITDSNSLFEIYMVGATYKVVPSMYSIFPALLVKWLINNQAEIEQNEENLTDFRIVLKEAPDKQQVSNFEYELYKLFERVDSSDPSIDGIDLKKLDRWLKVNNVAFLNWRDEILKAEARLLQSKGILEVVQMSERLQKKSTFTEYNATDGFVELGNTIQSMKKYLREYEGNTPTKEHIVYSQLFDSTNVYLNSLEDNGIDGEQLKELLGGIDKSKLLIVISRLNSVISTRLEVSKGKNIKQNKKDAKKAKKEAKREKKQSKKNKE